MTKWETFRPGPSVDRGDRVLVLDDEPGLAKRIAGILRDALMCDAEGCRDPAEAVLRQRDRAFDLIVSDLAMPGRDGLAVLAEIKASSPSTEVLIVTSYGDLQSAIEAMRLGASDYIKRGGDDEYFDELVRRARFVLNHRPGRRAPGLHRENLIGFLLDRTSLRPFGLSGKEGQLAPGLALEYAVKLLLESCDGFEVAWHRVRNRREEFDLVCSHSCTDGFWSKQPPIVLVECKDRQMRPGANDRTRFESKIRNRHGQCGVGFFVSTSGFASTFCPSASPVTIPGGGLPLVVPIGGSMLLDWFSSVNRGRWLTARTVEATL